MDQGQVKSSRGLQFDLRNERVHKLLDHSIGLIALECGYHMTTQSSLDTLNDICCEYLKKIAHLLRVAQDTESWRDSESDFVDNLERVFHQIHVSSSANLHQFICKMAAIRKHRQQQQLQQHDKGSSSIDINKF